MKYKVGDLVEFVDGSGEIMRINKIDSSGIELELYYFRPFICCAFLAKEEHLKRATLEKWKNFCGKHKDIYEKHKQDIINGYADSYINFMND